MDNIKVKSLNFISYFEYENKALIAILFVASPLVAYAFSQYLIYTIIASVLIVIIRFIALNKTYTTYSIVGKEKEYFLFSKILGSTLDSSSGQYSDKSITDKNYLEEFLKDFNYNCDWENSIEVDSYKQILSHVTYSHIPDSSNNQFTLPKMNKQAKSKYTSLMKNLDDNEKVKLNVGKLHETLSSIYSKRRTYNMGKSFSNLENLL